MPFDIKLYFSKQPDEIGGYILFFGATNLYQINIATKQVTEIIPLNPETGREICLDAISVDYRFVADHCTQNVITIRDLSTGGTTTIQPRWMLQVTGKWAVPAIARQVTG